jgi:TolA-binding protein
VWDAQTLIGETLAGQGKVDAAVAHFKAVEAETPEAKKPAVQFGLGMTLARAGRYDEARQAFNVILEKYQDSPLAGQTKLQSAVTLVKSGQRDLARRQLLAVAEGYPALRMSAAYWMARCDILESKFEDAKKSLEEIVSKKATIAEAADAIFDLAYCELALGDNEGAVKRLEGFRTAYPFSGHTAEALYYEATAMHRMGKFAESERLCEAVLKVGNTEMRRPAEMLKGENKLMEKSYAEADAIFEGLEVGASAKEKTRLALRRGQCAYYAADYVKAVSKLAPIAKEMTADPLQQEAVFLLGDAELQLKQFGEAIGTLQMYLQKPATHGDEASYKLAVAQLGAKNRTAASATLAKLIQGDMQNEWVQRGIFEMGRMAYEDRKLDAAGKAMNLVLATDAGEAVAAPAMYLAARVEMETGKPAEAAARLAELVKKYPKNTLVEEATYTRGAALKDAGKAKEAVAQFDAYIAAYPKGGL